MKEKLNIKIEDKHNIKRVGSQRESTLYVFYILLVISYFSLEVFNLLAKNFAQEEVGQA